jgi:hypothetical protein
MLALESRCELLTNWYELDRYKESAAVGWQALALREEILQKHSETQSDEYRLLLMRRNIVRHHLARSLHKLDTLQGHVEAVGLRQQNIESWIKLGKENTKADVASKLALNLNLEAITKLEEQERTSRKERSRKEKSRKNF